MTPTERELLEALQALVAQVERGDFDNIGAEHPDSTVLQARSAIDRANESQHAAQWAAKQRGETA